MAGQTERFLTMPDGMLTRAAPVGPRTFDPATGRVTAVLSSGLPVRGEILSTDPTAYVVAAPRLPLLDAHRRDSICAVIGHVENIRTEAGQIVADVTVTDEAARSMVEAGTLGISVGYSVQRWRDDTRDGARIRTATAWRLSEASLVPIAADPGSGFRSDPMPDSSLSIEPHRAQDRAEVNQSIRALSTRHNLGAPWADAQIDAAADLPAARDAALAEIERRAAATPPIRAHVGSSNDDPDVIRTRLSDALAHRMGGLTELPAEAVQYRGLGVHDMIRTALAARGERVIGLSVEALMGRAMVTGDLPNLLQSSGHRTLLGAYSTALSPVFGLFRQTTATDFRTMSRIRMGEMDALEKVAENGEITRGGFGEVAESYKVETFARIIGLGRPALINDDLGAFAQMAQIQGRAAAEKQNATAVTLLTTGSGLGPVMSDGVRLFHSTHGNVSGSGAVPDATTLAAGVLAMRTQKGIDGASPINATPSFLLVSPAKETAARQAVAAFYPATASAVNPLAGSLTVLVEARLTGNRWYLFADPAALPVFEYAYLASAPGPQLESRAGWDVLGMEFRVVLDFGCGAIDHRGSYTNAGA